MAPPGAAASAGELEPGAELLLPAPGGTRRGEEGGGPSLRRSAAARWPSPRLTPSPWRELGRPRAAAAWSSATLDGGGGGAPESARREEGRARADPPPRDGLHRASPRRRGGSSAARGPRRRGGVGGVPESARRRAGEGRAVPPEWKARGSGGMREPMPMNTEGKSSESSEGVRLKANAELGIGGDS